MYFIFSQTIIFVLHNKSSFLLSFFLPLIHSLYVHPPDIARETNAFVTGVTVANRHKAIDLRYIFMSYCIVNILFFKFVFCDEAEEGCKIVLVFPFFFLTRLLNGERETTSRCGRGYCYCRRRRRNFSVPYSLIQCSFIQ